MTLVHRTRDTFIAVAARLDAFLGDSGFATFAFGGDGKIASITLSEFGDVDGGRFVARPPSYAMAEPPGRSARRGYERRRKRSGRSFRPRMMKVSA